MLLASSEVINQVKAFDLNAITASTREQFNNYMAGVASDGQENNRVLTVAGSTAQISIKGMLTKTYSLMTWWYDGTAYSDIISAIELIKSDSSIYDVKVDIDSGGGQIAGLFNAIAAIQTIGKPVSCNISGSCCSAAFAMAAQCGVITASSEADTVGSIGIVVDAYVSEDQVSVTSSNAPKKRQDLKTEEGQADLRAELDDYEELFLESIAAGRNTTVENVIGTYGKGASMTARKALKYGMIDSIQTTNSNAQEKPEQTLTANSEETMNKAELQSKYPELYAELKSDFTAEGQAMEQDRVSAFAELGAASGATELAMTMIADGTQHSAAVNAKFMAAQMKNNTLNALAEDNVDTNNIDQTVSAQTEQEAIDAAMIAAFDGDKVEHY